MIMMNSGVNENNIIDSLEKVQSILSLRFDPDNFGKSDNDYEIIKDHPDYIAYIRNLSKDIIYKCIETNPYCFIYIPDNKIDQEISEEVLKRTPNPPEIVCLYSLRKDYNNIKYIEKRNQTYMICKYALEKDIKTVQYCDAIVIGNHEDLVDMVISKLKEEFL